MLVAIAYYLLFWIKYDGQTLGNRLMAVRVVREDGTKIDIANGVVRYIGYIISGVALGLGFLWVAFDKRKLESYFVEISESGIASWKKKAIQWEDVESAQMKEYTYDRFPLVKTRWIEIIYFDKAKEEVVPVWFPSCLEDFDSLYEHIQARVDTRDVRITTYKAKPKIDAESEGFLYVVLLALGFLLLSFGLFPSRDEWFPYQNFLMVVLGIIVVGYTVGRIYSQVCRYRL